MTQQNNPLYAPRQEGETDLLAEIREEFKKNDIPFTWFELQSEMKDGLTQTANQPLQMHSFKRTLLTLVLRAEPDQTRSIRAAILAHCSVPEFMEHLKAIYIPYLKADSLRETADS